MIFNISLDRERLLTASVRHFTLWVYSKKGHYLETIESLKAARVRAAMIRFVQKGNLFVVTLIATYSETDIVKFKVMQVLS